MEEKDIMKGNGEEFSESNKEKFGKSGSIITDKEQSETRISTQSREPPARLKRAETVLNYRTGRFCIVLERCLASHNQQAVLRTAEAFGVQNVWVIEPDRSKWASQDNDVASVHTRKTHLAKKVTKNCHQWLSLRTFLTVEECLHALKSESWEIWATDLSPKAVCLNDAEGRGVLCPLPAKLAVVIGRESDGVSQEMLQKANRRIYVPMFGFTESFNLSVATALVLQRLFDWCPEARGDLSREDKDQLREKWYDALLRNPTARTQHMHWKAKPNEVESFKDLRRKNDNHQLWIPPKIRKREGIQLKSVNNKSS
mmetsp:Transcript_23115/g.30006  ORF Transcript_23115/g.30006 Transcript_23115/m.30006 type:complete len:313 (-) Transcript_23115:58-996(-)